MERTDAGVAWGVLGSAVTIVGGLAIMGIGAVQDDGGTIATFVGIGLGLVGLGFGLLSITVAIGSLRDSEERAAVRHRELLSRITALERITRRRR